MKPKIIAKAKSNIKLVRATCSCQYTHNRSDAVGCSPASVEGPDSSSAYLP
jgi:hypothetical protein